MERPDDLPTVEISLDAVVLSGDPVLPSRARLVVHPVLVGGTQDDRPILEPGHWHIDSLQSPIDDPAAPPGAFAVVVTRAVQ